MSDIIHLSPLQPWLLRGKPALKFIVDFASWQAAAVVAFWLRLDDRFFQYTKDLSIYLLAGLPIKAVVIYWLGLQRQTWRKSGVRDLIVLGRATLVVAVAMLAVTYTAQTLFKVGLPRSVPLIEGMFIVLFLGGLRLSARLLRDRRKRLSSQTSVRRVLIVGAGEAGTLIAREMLRHPEAGPLPVGFLDDDRLKQGTFILGLPVFGDIAALTTVCQEQDIEEVLIAIPSAPGTVVRRVVELARQAKVRYRIIPALHDLLSGRVSIAEIREVDVADLLRRDPVELKLDEIAAYLKGRIVLVTGAGGSIGSEIVRQVVRFCPAQVILLGRGENSLWMIEQELRHKHPALNFSVVVADVRDQAKLKAVFETWRIDVIFHAAAHKHVPFMETNPDEAVLNNIGGTKNLVELALTNRVSYFVNISTDKAVNPTSVMGATKRIAEYVVADAARRAQLGQVFVSVRFGNVLGSRGSVIPLFREQIRRGGPVTVTHPDMQRYFMTIPEAAQLVLQAAGLGGNASIYVLDMGEPVRIVELAEELIRLSGLEPGRDIQIVFTGIRPGEKLVEELMTAEEGATASRFEKIYVANNGGQLPQQFAEHLSQLLMQAQARDNQGIRAGLQTLIPAAVLALSTNSGINPKASL